MSQSYRLDNVGLVNREKKLSFKFNGVTYTGI
jgi:sarcosine oxidase subunit alpha